MLTAILLLLSAPSAAAATTPKPSLGEPALAPDRPEIAFVSGGDIWRVSANGGEASLLVSHAANESRPLYSPDGRKLAFVSTRTGGGDIYVLTLTTGELTRLTYDDAPEMLDAWSRDGKWLYFTCASKEVGNLNDVFRVRADGGTPMLVSADRYTNEYFSAPAPDGASLLLTARGNVSAQWWRKGHSHLDQSEIWLRRNGPKPSYEPMTDGAAKELWPMWAPDGKSFFFVSDRNGAQNIWRKQLGMTSREVTHFTNGRVLWPTISYDGRTIVFERDFTIWKLDVNSGKTGEVPVVLRGAAAGSSATRTPLAGQFREMELSPDGKKVALVAHGEIFAASAKTAGDAERVTRSIANESDVTWAPDSRRIVYVSDRNGVHRLYAYDFAARAETPITSSEFSDANPQFSPDGRWLAFTRDGREVRIYDFEKKEERLLAPGSLDRQPLTRDRALAWAPDSRWIVFASHGTKSFTNLQAVRATGGASQPITFLGNTFASTVSWSPDGSFLLFDTGQRTEPTSLARVDLIPRTPRFREDEFRDLFKQPTPVGQDSGAPEAPKAREPAKPARATKPVEIVFEGIRNRLRLLPVGLDVDGVSISSDGKQALLTATAASQQNLYVYSLDDLAPQGRNSQAVARQITSTPGAKLSAQFSPDGKEIYYLEQGRIQIATVESRQSRPLAVNAEMDVDFQEERAEIFQQAWSYLRDQFFDEHFNGVDWNAVRQTYEPHALGAATPAELYRIINLMVGELNASHLGISAPQAGQQGPPAITGRLGLRFDPAEYESSGRLQITEVIPLGPAALADIKAGEYLLAVDGAKIDASANLDHLLENQIGHRVELTVSGSADGVNKRVVPVRPINLVTEKNLVYRKWVEDRRAYVDRISGGKLGYVHMRDMGADSLAQLHVDLDADNHAKEGVVVDIRNNNGGFVNAYAIDVLARKPYMTFQERGRGPAPARSVLGQRALELPTILVTNQHSLSDAEDFTEGYRRLKLGKVVGEPTAGWIVYTWNHRLIDGSMLRLPRVKVFDGDGQLMEMHPRPVDIPVDRPVGESYTDKDSQLDAAAQELMRQLAEAKNRRPSE